MRVRKLEGPDGKLQVSICFFFSLAYLAAGDRSSQAPQGEQNTYPMRPAWGDGREGSTYTFLGKDKGLYKEGSGCPSYFPKSACGYCLGWYVQSSVTPLAMCLIEWRKEVSQSLDWHAFSPSLSSRSCLMSILMMYRPGMSSAKLDFPLTLSSTNFHPDWKSLLSTTHSIPSQASTATTMLSAFDIIRVFRHLSVRGQLKLAGLMALSLLAATSKSFTASPVRKHKLGVESNSGSSHPVLPMELCWQLVSCLFVF